MLILGMIWVTSWFGGLPAVGEKLLDAPRYLSNVLFGNNNVVRVNRAELPQTLLVTSPPQSVTAVTSTSNPWTDRVEGWLVATSTTPDSSADPEDERSAQDFFEILENAVLRLPSQLANLNAPHVAIVEVEPSSGQRNPERTFLTCDTKSPSAPETLGGFQIWVKGCFVAQVPDQKRADAIAKSLQSLIENPDIDISNLRPEMIDGTAVAQLGDRVIFKIDDALAKRLGRPAELIVIEWTNNLRIALGAKPVALADAQVEMHKLQDMGGKIEGMASWYGPYFHGRQTATGEIFDQNELTAAHPTLPFDTYLRVTNLLNGKSVVVRVNDRGPYFDNRVLDLSNRAAQEIDAEHRGVVPIQVTIMEPTIETADASDRKVQQVSLVPQP